MRSGGKEAPVAGIFYGSPAADGYTKSSVPPGFPQPFPPGRPLTSARPQPGAIMPALPAHPRPLLRLTLVTLAALAWFAPAATVRADEVSFRNEVMAVLSRAGCNQGTCHGNLNGKNGFKLSLRGQDPDFDLAVLTRQSFGRRTNPQRPTESLLLLKATATVPHEGGKRFAVGSREYNLLRLDQRRPASRRARHADAAAARRDANRGGAGDAGAAGGRAGESAVFRRQSS